MLKIYVKGCNQIVNIPICGMKGDENDYFSQILRGVTTPPSVPLCSRYLPGSVRSAPLNFTDKTTSLGMASVALRCLAYLSVRKGLVKMLYRLRCILFQEELVPNQESRKALWAMQGNKNL